MTQSTEELVRAFKARGGRVKVIPQGTYALKVTYKSLFQISAAHTFKTKETRQVWLDTLTDKRRRPPCKTTAAVDVFMRWSRRDME